MYDKPASNSQVKHSKYLNYVAYGARSAFLNYFCYSRFFKELSSLNATYSRAHMTDHLNLPSLDYPYMRLALFLVLLLCLPVQALTVITGDSFERYNLEAGLEYQLEATSDRPDINTDWEVARDTLTFGFNPNNLWVRFAVRNTSSETQNLILDFPYPLLDEVDVYIEDESGKETLHRLGDTRPASAQEIQHPHLIADFRLPAMSEHQILIRVKTDATLNVPLTLWAQSAFISSSVRTTVFDMMMYGILVGIALYHLLLFAQLREPSYFWYSIFLITLVSIFAYFQGYINAYSFESLRQNSNHFLSWSYVLVATSCIFYIQRALDLPRSRPVYSKLLNVVVASGVALAIVAMYIPYSLSIKLLTAYAIIATLAVISSQAIRVLDQYEPAYYGFSASAFLLIGMTITVLEKTGMIVSTPVTRSAGDVGFTIMAIFYALLLSQRMRWEQHKRHRAELAARLSNAELLHTQQKLNKKLDVLVRERTIELEKTNEQLHRASITDPLTGLFNRRHFDQEFQRLHQDASYDGSSLSLILLDIDHFKAINDRYGHPAGDACLIDIANRIQSVAKNFDAVCARYGGEEFIILMANEDLSTSRAAAQTLLSLIREVPVSVSGHSIKVTASIGVIARHPDSSEETDSLLKAADELLYQAKSQGRDQICSPETTDLSL